MRITRIKLSGFKSFVDPTSLTLPGNLTAVVGPNGCGKSNIIDALIWVMGESSAKHLRGDSMADVIFNGSNSRKPVGQASVEIMFDNSDGKIGGQYAGYAEISLKRTLSRDGISAYSLNGTRCRRKDITNVFLGTGLGVRGGYSVIEQGMISRVVEAKPEELRGFLEEAAGISKYKERRRETETRIRHTAENMERLNDICEELEKQLQHLQRQARAAERYQALKQEQRLLEARVLGLRWVVIDRERQAHNSVILECGNNVEATLAQLRGIEAQQTAWRAQQTRATDAFNRVQSDFYSKSAEISRLEQTLKHTQERRADLEQDLTEARRSLDEAAGVVAEDSAQLTQLATSIAALEPRHGERAQQEQQRARALQEVEERGRVLQTDWDAFNQGVAEATRREHVEQIRLEHLEDGYANSRERASLLSREQEGLRAMAVGQALEQARGELRALEQIQDRLLVRRDDIRRALQAARQSDHAVRERLHDKRSGLEALNGKLGSLKALQEAALGRDQTAREAWLRRHGLGACPLLAEQITIATGWDRAIETVLWAPLGALCGEGLIAKLAGIDGADAPAWSVTVLTRDTAPVVPDELAGASPLLDKVEGPWPLGSLLAGVYTAETRAQALALQPRLRAHESVVTPDGAWLGPNWAQLAGTDSEQAGVLERERVLQELGERATALTQEVQQAERDHEETQQGLQAIEQQEHEVVEELQRAIERVAEARAAFGRHEGELDRTTARAQAIQTELEDLEFASEDNVSAIETARTALAAMKHRIDGFDEERDRLSASRRQVQDELDQARDAWRRAHEETHEIALKLESMRSSRTSLLGAVARNEQLKNQLAGRCADLESAIVSAEVPQKDLRDELERALGARLTLEGALGDARRQLEELDAELRANEDARVTAENDVTARREELEQARIEQREFEVRANEIEQRIAQTDFELKPLVDELPENATEEICAEQLEKVRNRIDRLGPINLAAIDEFTQISERKQYLDQQLDDLTRALATLREAIHTIDRETRTRFKETFDKVNDGLKAMFPILFGGGHAYLELTGDDLLETGVTVMARPPGKRNSTIHLLSGGEKALTAVAFVFAIFELNPAPFCLLDEVDAPLDDANVVRLSEMLRSMSERVQFICITHNKITMEIAEQLIGVTMQEPGVSRLVSVNMEEAVELAATA